jgi:hypothetical protein
MFFAVLDAWKLNFTALAIMMLAAGFIPSALLCTNVETVYSVYPPNSLSKIDQWFASLSAKGKKLVGIVFVTFAVTMTCFPTVQDMSLLAFGFRAKNVVVRMSKEDFDTLARSAIRLQIPLNQCSRISPDVFEVQGADILWHKFGTHALIGYPSYPLDDLRLRRQIRIEPLNLSIAVLTEPPQGKACREFPVKGVFQAQTSEISFSQTSTLKLDELFSKRENIKVFAKIFGTENDSHALAAARAQALTDVLQVKYHLKAEQVEVKVGDSAETKWDCDTFPSQFRKSCEAANERVEVLVEYI